MIRQKPKRIIQGNLLMAPILLFALFYQCSVERTYHVALPGDDAAGDGTAEKPWRSLRHAITVVEPNQGHKVKLSAVTFVEKNYISVPPGVDITGAGTGITVLIPDTARYSRATDWRFDRFLITLSGSEDESISQKLSNFSIDGISYHRSWLEPNLHTENHNQPN